MCGKGVEKGEISQTVGGNVNWCHHHGKQYSLLYIFERETISFIKYFKKFTLYINLHYRITEFSF